MLKALLSAPLLSLPLLAPASALAQEPPPPLPPPAAAPPAPAPPALPAPAQPAPAQPPPPVITVAPGPEEKKPAADLEASPSGAPAARTGFQMALRTGVAIPLGSVEGGSGTNAMSDYFSPQVPLVIDIGGKPIPNLFIGAYLGLAFGGAAGAFADACDRLKATCVSANVRLGIQAQYHFTPAEKMNPWIGYGIGVESSGVTGETSSGQRVTATVAGWEFAHLSAGLDFRLSRSIGLGPLVAFSLGQYKSATVESGGVKTEGDLRDTALHEWLTIGGRMVIFP